MFIIELVHKEHKTKRTVSMHVQRNWITASISQLDTLTAINVTKSNVTRSNEDKFKYQTSSNLAYIRVGLQE